MTEFEKWAKSLNLSVELDNYNRKFVTLDENLAFSACLPVLESTGKVANWDCERNLDNTWNVYSLEVK